MTAWSPNKCIYWYTYSYYSLTHITSTPSTSSLPSKSIQSSTSTARVRRLFSGLDKRAFKGKRRSNYFSVNTRLSYHTCNLFGQFIFGFVFSYISPTFYSNLYLILRTLLKLPFCHHSLNLLVWLKPSIPKFYSVSTMSFFRGSVFSPQF